MIDTITNEKPTTHPLEEIFDIESNTTLTEYVEVVPVDAIKPETYDKKDGEIEDQLQEIYEASMTQFESQSEEARNVDGKYKARNGEVAIQALNTALHAVRTKAEVKANKDKIQTKKGAGPSSLTQNNIVVADRNEILDLLDKE